MTALVGADDRGIDGGLLADPRDVLVANAAHPAHGVAQLAEPGPGRCALAEQVSHPGLALSLVLGPVGLADVLVVSGDGLEGLIRNALCDQGRGRSKQAVAAADAVVEEGERPPRGHGGHPEAHLAQLHRHLVDVDAVQAVAHHVPQGERDLAWGGFVVAAAHRGQTARDAVGRSDQEMARADRRIADLETREWPVPDRDWDAARSSSGSSPLFKDL